jgi:hypothetical protein
MTENTKARPGEYDALEKARPDELIFTLLERDPCAPPTIHHWCELRRKRARDIKDDDKRKAELHQITEAEFIAFTMQDRQSASAKGDAIEALPAQTYSGIVVERTELDELLPKLRSELSEGDYHAANALELARRAHELGAIDDAQLGHITDAARVMHAMALDLSPHRAALMAEAELPLDGSKVDG